MSNKSKKTSAVSVFISYSHKDSRKAKYLADKCEIFGLNAWLDEEELLPGDNWNENIEKAIKACDIAIVLISKNSFSSTWVNREWSVLCEEKWNRPDIDIIPIMLEGTEAPPFLCKYKTYSTKSGNIDNNEIEECLSKYIKTTYSNNQPEENNNKVRFEFKRLENRVRELMKFLEKSLKEQGRSDGN